MNSQRPKTLTTSTEKGAIELTEASAETVEEDEFRSRRRSGPPNEEGAGKLERGGKGGGSFNGETKGAI